MAAEEGDYDEGDDAGEEAAAEEEAPISMAGMAGGLAAMMANAKTADADAESRQSGWSDDDSVFGKAFVS